MNKNQSEGTAQNLKGRVEQAVGVVTGKKGLEAEGAADRAKGAAKKAVGDLKHKLAKKIDSDSPSKDEKEARHEDDT